MTFKRTRNARPLFLLPLKEGQDDGQTSMPASFRDRINVRWHVYAQNPVSNFGKLYAGSHYHHGVVPSPLGPCKRVDQSCPQQLILYRRVAYVIQPHSLSLKISKLNKRFTAALPIAVIVAPAIRTRFRFGDLVIDSLNPFCHRLAVEPVPRRLTSPLVDLNFIQRHKKDGQKKQQRRRDSNPLAHAAYLHETACDCQPTLSTLRMSVWSFPSFTSFSVLSVSSC